MEPSTSSNSSSTSCRIFLGNLSTELEELTIRSYSRTWGELVECRVMREKKSGRSRGFAFISYKNPSCADSFMSGCPHYIGDRRINAKRVDTSQTSSNSSDSSLTTKRLFVSFSIEDRLPSKFELEEYFGEFGVVDEISVHRPKILGECSTVDSLFTAYALVDFMQSESVNKCLAQEEHEIEDTRMTMRRIITSEGVIKRKMEIKASEQSKQGPPPAKIPSLLSSSTSKPITLNPKKIQPIMESAKVHVLAAFLDPRFKDYHSANAFNFNQKATKWLLKEAGEPEQDEEQEHDPKQDLSSPAPKMIRKKKTFFDDDFDDGVQGVRVSKMSGTEAEIVTYAKMKRIHSSFNPVKFWQSLYVWKNENNFPILAKFAIYKYMSAPATSVAIESIFSLARNIYDYKRTNLNPKKLMYLNKVLL